VTRVPAHGTSLRIGRAADNDVVLADQPAASRYHAELLRRGEGDGAGNGSGWSIRDVQSRNGTWVNGRRVAGEAVLGADDVVGIGEVTLRIIPAPLDEGTIDASSGAHLYKLGATLSDREREVLALVAAGHTDEQIGRELYISVKTVHSHLDHIRDKSGVRRRAELTRLAVRLGLSSPPPR
jgi:DNA-binding CsgD family transcriptional regulator